MRWQNGEEHEVPVYLSFFGKSIHHSLGIGRCRPILRSEFLIPLGTVFWGSPIVTVPRRRAFSLPSLNMTRSPPPSDTEPEALEYEYESDGEERLGHIARQLLHETEGNYRCKWGSQISTNFAQLALSCASCPLSLHTVIYDLIP